MLYVIFMVKYAPLIIVIAATAVFCLTQADGLINALQGAAQLLSGY